MHDSLAYQACLDWLYAAQTFGIKPGLENTRKLLDAFDAWPHPSQKVLHVAGTNGKGSTCAFLASLLGACNKRWALFSSPHLVRYNERMQSCFGQIGDDELVSLVNELRRLLQQRSDLCATFFEMSLALALRWFKQQDVEYLILETGMGGRLDATNCLRKQLAIITPIGMDHEQYLGNDLATIAGEKAGIIAEGVAVLVGKQAPEALQVLKYVAASKRSPLELVELPLEGYRLGLAGRFQQYNAALALASLAHLGIIPDQQQLQAGFANCHWPARMQSLLDGRVILDGAHNSMGIANLLEEMRLLYPGRSFTIVFSALADKEPQKFVKALDEICHDWVLVPINSPRAMSLQQLEQVVCSVSSKPRKSYARLAQVVEDLPALAERRVVLVCGSLYLAGELLSLLQQQPHRATAQ